MGYGSYDQSARSTRATTKGYATKSAEEIFSARLDAEMNPVNIRLRECRDSADHPNAVPIVVALDHTASMGKIPHQLIKDGLPHMMSKLHGKGVSDASVLFMAVGDHKSDGAPLQVGQFESGDEELDLWLTKCFLEGNGGGNGGESYFLPWQFAASHIKADAFEKRNKKGFLFTVGDEPIHRSIGTSSLKRIYGGNYPVESSLSVQSMLKAAQQNFEVYHIHVDNGYYSLDQGWRDLLGDHVIEIEHHNQVPTVVAGIVSKHEGKVVETLGVGTPVADEKPVQIL